MNDYKIRAALKANPLAHHNEEPNTVIIEELGLRHGTSRVDIAVVNGILHGFEIKSDQDTLGRLPLQAKIYSSVLDQATLVVAPKYLQRANEIIPNWWGITCARCDTAGSVIFDEIREPQDNPNIDPLSVTKLLWKQEALALLDEMGEAKGFRNQPRLAIYARVVEVANLEAIRSIVRHHLKTRKDWRPAVK